VLQKNMGLIFSRRKKYAENMRENANYMRNYAEKCDYAELSGKMRENEVRVIFPSRCLVTLMGLDKNRRIKDKWAS